MPPSVALPPKPSLNCLSAACVTPAPTSNHGRQPRSPATRAVVGCRRPVPAAAVAGGAAATPGNAVVAIA
jgi:hypothetical protein